MIDFSQYRFEIDSIPFAPIGDTNYMNDEQIIANCNLIRRKDIGVLFIYCFRSFVQNQGVAQHFLQEIINFAKREQYKCIRLSVRSENAKAKHVYEKLGFKIYYTHNKYNTSWMRLSLEEQSPN